MRQERQTALKETAELRRELNGGAGPLGPARLAEIHAQLDAKMAAATRRKRATVIVYGRMVQCAMELGGVDGYGLTCATLLSDCSRREASLFAANWSLHFQPRASSLGRKPLPRLSTAMASLPFACGSR